MSIESERQESLEKPQGDGQLALALVRALMIALVKVDERFLEELSGSLAEVAEKLKDEKGAGAEQVISNLAAFSRSLNADPHDGLANVRGRLH